MPCHHAGKGVSEDCLNVNVWTPGLDDKKRPVVVMYSGGGSTNGGNNNPVFNGPNFCKDREVVMVYPNFRLGMLGFLYLGHLLGEEYQASGSCGLMDQIFALKWVRENIENFGGDPDNITIMGQSAGAKSVCNMTLAPAADGMYRKVIAMSGANQVIRDLETARVITNRFLETNGIKKEDAAKLLELSGEEILELQEKYFRKYGNLTGPVCDGKVLPISLDDRLSAGAKNGVSILIGHTLEESGVVPSYVDEEGVRNHMNNVYGISAEHVFSVYSEYKKTMPKYMAWTKIMTKYNYGDAAIRFAGELAAAGATVWSYRWDYIGLSRPTHGTDLCYVCGYADEDARGKQIPKNFDYVSRLMNDSFMNFIEYGNPQTDDTKDWKPYTNSENGTRMYFSDYPSAEPFSLENYDHEFPDSQFILKEKGANEA